MAIPRNHHLQQLIDTLSCQLETHQGLDEELLMLLSDARMRSDAQTFAAWMQRPSLARQFYAGVKRMFASAKPRGEKRSLPPDGTSHMDAIYIVSDTTPEQATPYSPQRKAKNMGELKRAKSEPAFYQSLDRRLDWQVGRMRYSAELSKEGMYALGEVHSHAEYVAMRTLLEADKLKQLWSKDCKLTPAEEHSYHVRIQLFLDHLGQITDRAGRRILFDIMDMPVEQRGSALSRFLDGLFGTDIWEG